MGDSLYARGAPAIACPVLCPRLYSQNPSPTSPRTIKHAPTPRPTAAPADSEAWLATGMMVELLVGGVERVDAVEETDVEIELNSSTELEAEALELETELVVD